MKKILLTTLMALFALHAQAAEDHYTYPGITAQKDGKWIGSDHMLNLSNSILVELEISKPDDLKIDIPVDQLKSEIEKQFKDAGIDPAGRSESGKPPLPFFQVLVIIYNIPEGYAFSVDGRLFEEVHLTRAKLSEGVFMQAITWNSDSIQVASTQKIQDQLQESIADVTKSFIERYKFFKELKNK
ncbi:hypothetical protein [Estrella lausannensis]|uniref:Secreted protein n=1 Tax=Estrella lausannensis TaxID=483423 RepID=A0A0H5DQ47_9BACT|nr:hypothetical protein [Estrella lausannensis]CRX38173.1 Conserved hypothetical protein [Estrella lausannensis]